MNRIAKHTLLFGAFAMLLSTVPVQALDAPADVQAEVKTKRRFFAGWTKDARTERMKNARKELDKAFKPFIACVTKGKEDCGPRAKVVRNIVITILALVGVTGAAAVSTMARDVWQRGFRPKKPTNGEEAVYGELETFLSPQGQELIRLTALYVENPVFYTKAMQDQIYKTSEKAAIEEAFKRLQAAGFDDTSSIYQRLKKKK